MDRETRLLLLSKAPRIKEVTQAPGKKDGSRGDMRIYQGDLYIRTQSDWLKLMSGDKLINQEITKNITEIVSEGAVTHSALSGVSSDQHHNKQHSLTSAADHTGTLSVAMGGTGVTSSNTWLNSRITTNADGSLNYDATGATAVNHDNLAGFASNEHYTQANIVATGALNSGSITSGFGTINTGSSTITTSGTVSTGALTIGGNIDFNSGTIDLSTQTVDVTLNDAQDALNFDSNTLSIDASNNRVGIGEPSPDTRLEVLQATTQLKLSHSNGIDTTFGTDSSGYLTITPSGSRIYLANDDLIGSTAFASGFTGHGWRISDTSDTAQGAAASGEATATFDTLYVRGTMSVYEMLIQQIRATNGSLIVSSAAKVESVANYSSGTDEVGEITFESTVSGTKTCPFIVNDIIMSQRVKVDTTVDGDVAFDDANVVTKKVLKVTAVSQNVVTTGDAGFTSGTAPVEGDEFVRIGNTGTASRQNVVYLTSDDEDAPFIDIKAGLNTYAAWNAEGSTRCRLGRLDGLTAGGTNDFGFWAGTSTTNYIIASDNGTGTARLEIHADANTYTSYTGTTIQFYDDGNKTMELTGGGINIGAALQTATNVDAINISSGGVQIYGNDQYNFVTVDSDGVTIQADANDKAVISTSGLAIHAGDGSNAVASFGATTYIGLQATEHIKLTGSSMEMKDGSAVMMSLSGGNITTKGIIKIETATTNGDLGLLLENDGEGYNQLVFKGANPEIRMGYTGSGDGLDSDMSGSSKIFMCAKEDTPTDGAMASITFDEENAAGSATTSKFSMGYAEDAGTFRIVTGADVRTDANVALLLNSSGDVGIGAASPDVRCHLKDNVLDDYVLKVENSDGGSYRNRGIKVQCGNDSNSVYALSVYSYADTFCGYIKGVASTGDSGDSDYSFGTDSPYIALVNASDERLKENIQDTEWKGLEKITSLKLRQFSWKKSQRIEPLGVIAQEVYDIIPRAVSKPEDELNDEGEIGIGNQWGITYEGFVLPLIKAVQELSAKVTALEAQI